MAELDISKNKEGHKNLNNVISGCCVVKIQILLCIIMSVVMDMGYVGSYWMFAGKWEYFHLYFVCVNQIETWHPWIDVDGPKTTF